MHKPVTCRDNSLSRAVSWANSCNCGIVAVMVRIQANSAAEAKRARSDVFGQLSRVVASESAL
jgi:hypothetical protein